MCHSHRNRENRTCHWGFDSANWRAYLHLADDYTQEETDKLMKTVTDFKSRYQANNQKRKLVSKILYLIEFIDIRETFNITNHKFRSTSSNLNIL